MEVFTQFQAYRVALEQHLTQGQQANTIGAHGVYNDSSVTITAGSILVRFCDRPALARAAFRRSWQHL